MLTVAGTSAQACAGTSAQACAACRHQRRKCTSDCPLAPFFPIDNAKEFISAHRIFGVSNILKFLHSLDTMEKKQTAVQCFCWEAECREKDPVEGSWGYCKKVCDKILRMKKFLVYLIRNPGPGCQSNNNFQVQNTSVSFTPPETSGVAAATSDQNNQLLPYSNEASNQTNLEMNQISHPILLQGMPTGGTSGQACAACKHQRRKCSPDCPLAPFFPPENTQKFRSAHRIFGVSNILKMLSSLDTMEKKQTLVRTICWEAECREEDPAGSWGYYKKICEKAHLLGRYIEHLRKNPCPSGYQPNNKLQLQDTSICSSVPGSSRATTMASHQIHQPPVYYNKNPNYVSNQENLGMVQRPYPSSLLQGVAGFNHSAGGDHMLVNQGSGIKEEK